MIFMTERFRPEPWLRSARSNYSRGARKYIGFKGSRFLHDTAEAYTGDPPSVLPARNSASFKRMEDRIDQSIAEALDVRHSYPFMSVECRRLDRQARVREVRDWLPHADTIDVCGRHKALALRFRPAWSSKQSLREFMRECKRLGLA